MATNGQTYTTPLNSNLYLQFNVSETENSSGNSSKVNWSLYIVCTAQSNFNNNQNAWYVQIDGSTVSSGNSGYNLSTGQSLLLSSGTSGDIGHNANGSKAINVRGYYDYAANLISQTYTLADYSRPPATPSFASVTRATGSSTLVVTLNTVSDPAGGTITYNVDYNVNNGGFGNSRSQTSNVFSFALSAGNTYQFRVSATGADGTSGLATSPLTYTIPNVPGAPASITVGNPAGRVIRITAGTAAPNNAAVDGYFVQTSSDNGATYGTAVSMGAGVSQTYDTPQLAGGLTYKFRVYAHNEMGNSAITTSTTGVFVPAGGKRFRGPAEANPGTYQNTSTASIYRAGQWVGLSTSKKLVISDAITNVVDNGATVTYTAINKFVAGNSVTITGVLPVAYNLTNAVVLSATSTSFVITTDVTGTYAASTGTAFSWADFI
jgi:hypothetical protein